MYLSRLILNPRSREVRRDLGNIHEMHRTLMSAFPEADKSADARAQLGVLYRIETTRDTGWSVVIVQSLHAPNWDVLPESYLLETQGDPQNPATKQLDAAYAGIRNSTVLGFRLRANPTKKICTKTGPDGTRRNGKRVELRGDEKLFGWLSRKGEQSGFRLLSAQHDGGMSSARAVQEARLKGTRPARESSDSNDHRQTLTVASVLFEGVLRVTDSERFHQALESGIGPGKAYGCGLLSVRPVEQGVQP